LALSSRNEYLTQEEKKEALKISNSLKAAANMVSAERIDVEEITYKMYEILSPLEVSYIAIVDREFRPLKRVQIGDTIILVEAIVGVTRLLDNIWL
jgi:pantoate--beta-alanine ligase